MKRIAFVSLSLMMFFGTSCVNEKFCEVQWVADADDCNLPAETESGYNTFGAYINGKVFSSKDMTFVEHGLYTSDNELKLFFQKPDWRTRDDGDYANYGDSLVFCFNHKHIDNFEQLVDLDGLKIDFSQQGSVALRFASVTRRREVNIDVEKGELFFRRVQRMHFDGEVSKVVLSGNFFISGTAVVSGQKQRIEITDGRFDISVNRWLVHEE